MRLVLISDTHGYHEELDIPQGDVLIHAGDLTRRGGVDEVEEFGRWLTALPHPHKLVIAGNHDWCFQVEPTAARRALGEVTYLQDSGTAIRGLRFWGSPWQPEFMNWAFNLPRGGPLAEKWADIPEDTDVLITHGPPLGVLDIVRDGTAAGCEDLSRRLDSVRPALHVFGHIHEARGSHQAAQTLFVNASIGFTNHGPIVVDILDGRATRCDAWA